MLTLVFTAQILSFALYLLSASGHFPRHHRAVALASRPGPMILYGTIAIAVVSLLVALLAAWRLIPWYAAVISGGLAILLAPLVLQRFPDHIVDGRVSLIGFAGL